MHYMFADVDWLTVKQIYLQIKESEPERLKNGTENNRRGSW